MNLKKRVLMVVLMASIIIVPAKAVQFLDVTPNYWGYEAIMELEDIYRIPFVLHYIEGYSTKEIAKILDISLSNVKIRLQRARIKLQDMLKGE